MTLTTLLLPTTAALSEDGFASGLIYGMLDGRELDEVVRLGWAHGALSTTFPGGVTMARLPEVETFAKGGSARVQR
jgi:2-dehydro-3-deoxygluconokinase